MKTYTGIGPRAGTPQTEPIPGSSQVPNSAGGFAWAVDKWMRLERFLVLGSEGGSYYASERDLTVQNAKIVSECIAEDGPRAVSIIVAISQDGRAPKNDPAIFALAMALGASDQATRQAAYAAIPKVCRIGTHLFHLAEYIKQFRGWSRGLRRAFGNWYIEPHFEHRSRDPQGNVIEEDEASAHVRQLVLQLIKYRQRDGWSHRDILRKAHPASDDIIVNQALAWATDEKMQKIVRKSAKSKETRRPVSDPLFLLEGFERVQSAKTSAKVAKLVREYGLPREAIPTEHLGTPEVWEALLEGMPITALIRNLPTLTRNGLLAPMSDNLSSVVDRITNKDILLRGRVHPLNILIAMTTYESGHSLRGSATWEPVSQVVDALDEAFYLAFDTVEPTGKRTMLSIDVSGSMDWQNIANTVITPRTAAAAMALVTASVEPHHLITAFSHRLVPISLSPRQRLDDAVNRINSVPMGGTDCALPMLQALNDGLPVDTFIIYTDSETWAGRNGHPAQALQQYREKMGIPAKLIVVGMVSNGFSIADPNDPGMLDVVGFDTATPNIMSAFSQGGF